MAHVAQAELRSRAANGQGDRPLPKTHLPFRFKTLPLGRGKVYMQVEYDGPAPPGDRRGTITFRITDATPHMAAFIEPLKEVCDLFWQLEAKQDTITKERDDAVMASKEAEQQLRKSQEKVAELERKLKKKEIPQG